MTEETSNEADDMTAVHRVRWSDDEILVVLIESQDPSLDERRIPLPGGPALHLHDHDGGRPGPTRERHRQCLRVREVLLLLIPFLFAFVFYEH